MLSQPSAPANALLMPKTTLFCCGRRRHLLPLGDTALSECTLLSGYRNYAIVRCPTDHVECASRHCGGAHSGQRCASAKSFGPKLWPKRSPHNPVDTERQWSACPRNFLVESIWVQWIRQHKRTEERKRFNKHFTDCFVVKLDLHFLEHSILAGNRTF